MSEDITTKPGFVASARKAIVAGVGAFASALAPAIVVATQDGVVTAAEAVPLVVTALGLGLAAFVGVYAVRNDVPEVEPR